MLLCGDHFAWQLQEFVCLGPTFAWQAQYVWSIHFKVKIVKTYCNSEAKCLAHMSFLKDVSQKRFVCELQIAWFLKDVSQKCFVFALQSFISEGSLAEMLRFWSSKLDFGKTSRRKASFCFGASKLHFWRKSRRKASFLSFKVSILKEASQKSFGVAGMCMFHPLGNWLWLTGF